MERPLKRQKKSDDNLVKEIVTFESSSKEKSNLLRCESSTNTLIGLKGGYRTARASHGISRGSWYYEVKVMPCVGTEGHVRAGWLTKQADLACPVGFAEDSYAVRDIDGSKINVAYRQQYMKRKFKVGDVLGCLIQLSGDQGNVSFTLNGETFGKAYDSVRVSKRKRYFPAVSLYMQGKVQWNFGPSFAFPPRDLVVEESSNNSSSDSEEKSVAAVSDGSKSKEVIRPMCEACKDKYQQRIVGTSSSSSGVDKKNVPPTKAPTPPPLFRN